VLRYNYLYVGLPALDAEEFSQRDEPLGWALASLMKLPKERLAEIKASTMSRVIDSSENDYRKFLLAEFIQAYLPLDEKQQLIFNQLLSTPEYSKVNAMSTTWFDQGHEKGLKQGIEQGADIGRRDMTRQAFIECFGPPSEELDRWLDAWPSNHLLTLLRAIYRSESIDELLKIKPPVT
jgi:hypothetical protein